MEFFEVLLQISEYTGQENVDLDALSQFDLTTWKGIKNFFI